MNLIIILIILIIGNITNGFIHNNKFYKNSLQLNYYKMFENENNLSIEDPIYIIISFRTKKTAKLLDDMNYFGLQTVFCDMHNYNKKELKNIYFKYIRRAKFSFNYSEQPWIFENNKFIGGLFEIYSKIYENI